MSMRDHKLLFLDLFENAKYEDEIYEVFTKYKTVEFPELEILFQYYNMQER